MDGRILKAVTIARVYFVDWTFRLFVVVNIAVGVPTVLSIQAIVKHTVVLATVPWD